MIINFIGSFAQTMDYWHRERNNENNRKLSAKLLLQILSIRSISTSCHSVIIPSRPPLMTAVVWSATPSWLGFCCADAPTRSWSAATGSLRQGRARTITITLLTSQSWWDGNGFATADPSSHPVPGSQVRARPWRRQTIIIICEQKSDASS